MANRQVAVRAAVAEGSWYDSLPRSTKLPTASGILVMAVVLMGFGAWGNMAPIAGAVVASGVLWPRARTRSSSISKARVKERIARALEQINGVRKLI
jgi:hypothetical protein